MKRLSLLALSALLATALTGCDFPDTRVPVEQRQLVKINTQQGGRVNVTKISEFRDDLAYGDYRGVYIITDTETGQEFVGVSGVGISAIGSHGCGKGCTKKDER